MSELISYCGVLTFAFTVFSLVFQRIAWKDRISKDLSLIEMTTSLIGDTEEGQEIEKELRNDIKKAWNIKKNKVGLVLLSILLPTMLIYIIYNIVLFYQTAEQLISSAGTIAGSFLIGLGTLFAIVVAYFLNKLATKIFEWTYSLYRWLKRLIKEPQ